MNLKGFQRIRLGDIMGMVYIGYDRHVVYCYPEVGVT
jgi:hypothetical protein